MVLQGNFLEAENLFLQAFPSYTTVALRGYAPHIMFRLAQIYARTDRLQLSREYADEAIALFKRMGMKREVGQVTEFLRQLS